MFMRLASLTALVLLLTSLMTGCSGRSRRGDDDDDSTDGDADADADADLGGPDIDGDGHPEWECPSGSTGWDGVTCGYLAPPREIGNTVIDGLARLNWWRSLDGLDSVSERSDLSRGCQLHLQYLIDNGVFGHFEEPGTPGYTEEGAQAGPASELAMQQGMAAGGYTMGKAIDGWMYTLYHRLRSFDPNLTEVGLALETDSNGIGGGGSLAMSCLNDSMGMGFGGTMVSPTPFPAPGLVDVQPFFEGYESPCPTRSITWQGQPGVCAASGTIVTLEFWQGEALGAPEGGLLDPSGQPVPGLLHYLGSREAPNQEFLDGVIAFVPDEPLETNATYTVSIDLAVNGSDKTFEWTFETSATAPMFPLPL